MGRRGKSTRINPLTIPNDQLARGIRVVHVDDHILVVDKPAGLTTVRHAGEVATMGRRAKEFLPPTLVDLLPRVVKPKPGERFRAVHRLDKETSGLIVLARTQSAERALGLQFRDHAVDRHYLALVRGSAKNERIESYLVTDRGDGRRGSGLESAGQLAITQVEVLEVFSGYSLVQCTLETGRTHQVRVHLGEAGTPLCGERIYDRPLHGKPWPDGSAAQRPLLHAAYLAIHHPATHQRRSWTSPLPSDMKRCLQRLQSVKS